MKLLEFASLVPEFNKLTTRELICHFAWFLHVHKSKETMVYADIRGCFRELHLKEVDVSVYMPQMANKREPDLIKVKGGYKLEGTLRRTFDARVRPTRERRSYNEDAGRFACHAGHC
jgi:hypothetical protein